ncbi:hydrogenase expression/formation protein HypE [Mesoterricola silvestris]|uniref:Hydrogenase expression/formation protein HypE n=1 Tax=Mesoterricola silvestris TaxID=2927979 RepID=A0AA48KA18_9BACT|nr:hydrogenase expression/formation protein HypE [Mesoterricola silvestris]BDU72877.1 hydrogenase expression/formation protein HypE [Mesoterricola silvestris]
MDIQLNCPVPLRHDTIQMAHGGGGRMMRELLESVLLPAFRSEALDTRHDAAVLALEGSRLAFTTDTYVVRPRFFPGGDIGELAVYGTVNDLAMAGARPLYLSVGMVLEEGYPIEELRRVAASMKAAADRCGVSIVTGDTKVVDRGKGDGLYINTAGIGAVPAGLSVGPRHVRPGDAVLVSGDVGRHGVAVMSVREGIAFTTPVESDCGPLHGLVGALLGGGVVPSCLRDATRGGLAAVLNEIATDAAVGVEVHEADIPVIAGVEGACELLGLDPYYVACEGRMVAFVPGDAAERALAVLHATPGGEGASRIGTVTEKGPGTVILRTRLGTRRILDLLSGEQLPRIC